MSATIDKVVSSQVHIGTLKSEAHPKTSQYWLDVVQGIVVFNPEMIAKQLDAAREKVQKYKKEGKDVLVVCEKKMYAPELETLASASGVHFLNYKAPAWFLTNFDTLKKRVSSMNGMVKFLDSEEYANLTKKEQLIHKRRLSKVQKVYRWVQNLQKKPELVIVVDAQMMKSFVDEVVKEKIDNILVATSNFSRRWAEDCLLMANIGSYKSIDFVLKYILS